MKILWILSLVVSLLQQNQLTQQLLIVMCYAVS